MDASLALIIASHAFSVAEVNRQDLRHGNSFGTHRRAFEKIPSRGWVSLYNAPPGVPNSYPGLHSFLAGVAAGAAWFGLSASREAVATRRREPEFPKFSLSQMQAVCREAALFSVHLRVAALAEIFFLQLPALLRLIDMQTAVLLLPTVVRLRHSNLLRRVRDRPFPRQLNFRLSHFWQCSPSLVASSDRLRLGPNARIPGPYVDSLKRGQVTPAWEIAEYPRAGYTLRSLRSRATVVTPQISDREF